MKIMDRLMQKFKQAWYPDGFPEKAYEKALMVAIICREFYEWCDAHVDQKTLDELRLEVEQERGKEPFLDEAIDGLVSEGKLHCVLTPNVDGSFEKSYMFSERGGCLPADTPERN
jgi:hypothetical protein